MAGIVHVMKSAVRGPFRSALILDKLVINSKAREIPGHFFDLNVI
jgi:hypothetical protein